MKRSAGKHFAKNLTRILLLFALTAWGGSETPTDLKVEIVPVASPVLVTEEARFTVTVSNISDEDAYKAKMEAKFPVGEGTVSGTDWSCSSSDDGTTETVTCQYTGDSNWLKAGESRTLTVTRTTSSPGNVDQSVTVWADNPDSDTDNNDASATVVAAQTNVQISKKATDGSGNEISEVNGQETFRYVVTLTNPDTGTTRDAANLTVTDTIPDGFTPGALSDGCTASGQTVTCDVASLSAGSSVDLVFEVTAPASGFSSDPYSNTASVTRDGYASVTNESGWPVTSNDARVTVRGADLVVKSFSSSPEPLAVGSETALSLVVTNGGNLGAENVKASFTVPSGLTYRGFSGTDWSCDDNGGGEIVCSLTGTLDPGDAPTLSLTLRGDELGAKTTSVSLSTDTAEYDENNNADSVVTTVKGADLDITKSGPAEAYADTDVTYTITVSNENGTADAANVVVTDTPASGMSNDASSDCPDYDADNHTCTLGTVGAGESVTFHLTWHMPNQKGDIDNTVTVSTDTPQDNTQNTSSTATVTLKAPELTVDKSVDKTRVGMGETFLYTVTVDNPADQTRAYSLTLKETLPAGLVIDDLVDNPDGWQCGSFPKTDDFECTLGQLDTGKSSTLQFKAHSDTAGEYVNHVQLDHSLTANDDNADAPKVTVEGVELDVTKNGDTAVDVGGTIAYELKVKNDSLSDAGEVTLTDDISSFGSGFAVASVTQGEWDCSASTSTKLECTLSSLASGDEKTVSFTVSVPDDAAADSVTNRASAASDGNAFDSNALTTTIRKADVEVQAPSDLQVNANESVAFDIVVKNNGPATAKDVNATVDLNTNGAADFVNVSIDCGGGTLSGNECRFGDMAQNDSYTIRVTADAPNYASGDAIENRVSAVTSSAQSQTSNDADEWSVTVLGATLVAHIDRPRYNVSVGETFPFEIYVENSAGATAEEVKVTDTVGDNGGYKLRLSNLRFENAADWDCSSSSEEGFVCTYQGSLNAGEATSKIYVDATVPDDAGVIERSLYDKVSLESATALSDDSVTPVYKYVYVHGPRLTTTKTVDDDRVSLGQRVTFTITVTNSDGYADAEETNVTDTLPEGFSNITTDGCANDVSGTDDRNILCELGTIGAGNSASFTVSADAPTIDGTYTNTATAATATPEKVTSDNSGSVDVTVVGADLEVTKSSPNPVATNSYFNYTIRLRNIGESPAEGAEVNDTLPSEVSFDAILSTGSGWSCDYASADHEVRCSTSETLDPGYDATVAVVRVRAPDSPQHVLNTVVTATQTSESNLDNNRFELDTLVININLQARKLVNGTVSGINIWSDDPTYVGIGGDIVYEIQVRNQPIYNNGGDSSNIAIPDINVSDILPDNITDVSYTADSRFDCSLDTPPLLLGSRELTCTMKEGDTNPLTTSEGWIRVATITAKATDNYYYTDPHEAIDEVHNWITNKYQAVTSLGDQVPDDNAPGGDYLEAHTLIRPANLSVAKSAPSEAGALQTFEYRVVVTNAPRNDDDPYNQASTAAEDVEVEENLPDEVTYVGFSGSGWSLEHNDSDTNTYYFKYSSALAPDESAEPLVLTVKAPNETGLTVTNTAKTTTTTAERDDLKDDNEQSVDTLIVGTDIRLEKSGPAKAGANKEILYTLTVHNDSSVPALEVRVFDTLPAGVTLPADWDQSGTEWDCNASGSDPVTITCLYGSDIPGGESADVTIKVTTPPTLGTIVNDANATALTVETDYGNNHAAFSTDIEGAALTIVSVTQSPDNDPGVGAITPVEYNISVKNTGYSDSSDLNLTLEFERLYSDPYEFNVTDTSGDWNCEAYDAASRTLRCSRGSLAADAEALLRVRAVAPNANRNAAYEITVYDVNDSNANDAFSGSTKVVGADLNITKSVEDPEAPGYHDDNVTVGLNKTVRFKISVDNNDLGLAKNVILQDAFDEAFADINITETEGWDDCSFDAATRHLECRRSELARDDTPLSVVVQALAPSTEGNTTNVASVDSYTVESDPDNYNDGVFVTTVGSLLRAEINASAADVAFREPFDYALVVSNEGKTEAEDLVLTDTLPADFTYIGYDSDEWSCDSDDNRTVTCQLARLEGYGASSQILLHVRAGETIGSFANEFNVTSPSVTAPLETSGAEVTVHGADLNVSLQTPEAQLLEEHNTTFTFTVGNVDLSKAYEVNATLLFDSPTPATIVGSDDDACEADDAARTLLCSWPVLEYEEERTVTVTVTLPNVDEDENLTARLSVVTVTEQPDPQKGDDTAEVSVLVRAVKPVAEWRMDECEWSTVEDNTGNGYDATPQGEAQTVNKILTKDEEERVSFFRAGSFDGDGDYVDAGDSFNDILGRGSRHFTLTLWVQPTELTHDETNHGTSNTFVAKASDSRNDNLEIGINPDGSLHLYLDTRRRDRAADIGGGLDPRRWHFVAVTYDDGLVRVMIDGNLYTSTRWNGGGELDGAAGSPFTIGASLHVDNFFHGYIDEVKLFDISLDETAMRTIYEREKRYINYDGSDRGEEMSCRVNATIRSFVSDPASVAVENSFLYRVEVTNNSLEPIEEMNLSVSLPAEALIDPDAPETLRVTGLWDDCTLSGHELLCRFDDEGNLSNAWFFGQTAVVEINLTAPNLIATLNAEADLLTAAEDENPDDNHETARTSVYGTNLRVQKRSDVTNPSLNQPFVYTIVVTNDSSVPAKRVKVIDTLPEEIVVTDNNHSEWDHYAQYDGTHTIEANVSLIAPGESKTLILTVTAPRSGTFVNRAGATTYTAEAVTADNNDSVSVTVGTTESNTTVILKDGFSKRKTQTRYGDMVVIGNTALTGSSEPDDLLADINATAVADSTARLELPYDDANITVTYARLYWTGHLHGEPRNADDDGLGDDSYRNITFVTPDGTFDLRANESDTFYYYNKSQDDTYRRIYACSYDVTEIVRGVRDATGFYNGNYGVRDLKANEGEDPAILMATTEGNTTTTDFIKIGHFGGWSLAVFYEVNHRAHRAQVYKNINLFDGFKRLIPAAVGYDRLTIGIDGFLTPYAGDKIDSRLMLFNGGGERSRAVDYLSIVRIDENVTAEVNVSDALNPEDNVLNGTITQLGVSLEPRSPNLEYSVGIDMDQFDISSRFDGGTVYLGHLQEETNISLAVGRTVVDGQEVFDQAFPSAIGLSTEIYNPDFIDSFKDCYVPDPITGDYTPCSETNITRGGYIVYRIAIVNTGNTYATKLVFQDPLPAEVSWVDDEADLKVVSITEPLCDGSEGGEPSLGENPTFEQLQSCREWLIAKGYFDEETGLTPAGREYINSLDFNATNNHLAFWDTGFPDSLVDANTRLTHQDLVDMNLTDPDRYPPDVNRTLLTIRMNERLNYNSSDVNGTFPALHVSWVEFKVKVNTYAVLNQTFMNQAVINFTNPTLEYYGYPDADQRQESASNESPPVVFQWTALSTDIKDPGRDTVGTKVVNIPFDLNISIDSNDTTFAAFAANYPDVNLSIWSVKLVDRMAINAGGTCDSAQAGLFDRNSFTLINEEFQPIREDMYWVTDNNFTLPAAWRDLAFCLQFIIRYTAGGEAHEELSPAFYGPFGDDFAMRPAEFSVAPNASVGTTAAGYPVIRSGTLFSLGIFADNGMGSPTPGYDQNLSVTLSNDANATTGSLRIYNNTAIRPCSLPVDLDDLNVTLTPAGSLLFVDGSLANTANTLVYKDVGFVTIKVRDDNWTYVDRIANDCDANVSNEGNNTADVVSCAVTGETDMLFIPDRIEADTVVSNRMSIATYMSGPAFFDTMSTGVTVTLRSLNAEGNLTENFDSNCYGEDVNLTLHSIITIPTAETQSYTLSWQNLNNDTEGNVTLAGTGMYDLSYLVDDSNFTGGVATLNLRVVVDRNNTYARYPLRMDDSNASTAVSDYLGSGFDINESFTLSPDAVGTFWYGRIHAPDYRSATQSIETPIFVEIFCDNDRAPCALYGIAGMPESSDDVNWWVNTDHDTNVTVDLNATQRGTRSDPAIRLLGGTNAVDDLDLQIGNGVSANSPDVTYTGDSNYYRTRIRMRVHEAWLRYNRFFADGRSEYNVEFNLPADDWSGIGTLGETVETNGSAKSNRRLEW